MSQHAYPTQRPPAEAGPIAAGSAFGQINLLADVAARQAEEAERVEAERKRERERERSRRGAEEARREVSVWPGVRGWVHTSVDEPRRASGSGVSTRVQPRGICMLMT